MMDLPHIVKAFFDADRRNDRDAVVAAFSPHASVTDEAVDHQGCEAIRNWWTASKEKYQHATMPIEVVNTADQIKVRATVTGRFPGSPATLNYTFTVADGKITALEIG